jgi:hypothetical protein
MTAAAGGLRVSARLPDHIPHGSGKKQINPIGRIPQVPGVDQVAAGEYRRLAQGLAGSSTALSWKVTS